MNWGLRIADETVKERKEGKERNRRKRLLTLIFNLVPPEMVRLVPSETTVCQGEIISFVCSANSNPAVHTYQLYVNGTMVNEVISTGVWNRTIAVGGVFVYKCTVNNTIGTATSKNVIITVNGNYIFFILEQKMSCPEFCSS